VLVSDGASTSRPSWRRLPSQTFLAYTHWTRTWSAVSFYCGHV
jgi:hypothetical protein